MKSRYVFVLFFLIQCYSLVSFSQADNPKFTHLTTNDGLSQSSVFAILKDYKGFMWFGTGEGLNKYDGYKFTIYKHDPENPVSISGNSISELMEDTNHDLWVLSTSGLDKFDRMKESFIHYNSGDSGVIFRSIFQDSKKRIWLGTSEGFSLFDPGTGRFKFYKNKGNEVNSLLWNYVYKITEDDYGELWMGTRNGLSRFNPETEKFIHYHNDPANNRSIGAGYIKTVYKDIKGNIWVGAQGSGIGLFNRQDSSFINFKHDARNKNSICHNDILSFTEDNNGRLWIGTENGGISVFDYSNNSFICYRNDENDPNSLSGNSIYSLYKDGIGNIWAGTWSGGINLHPLIGDKFALYRRIPGNKNSIGNNLVLSISNGTDNNIWIGTDGGGLSQFDPQTKNFKNYQKSNSGKNSIYNNYIVSISAYLPGYLALGFHRGGLDLFDVQKQTVSHFPLKNLNSIALTSPSVNILYKDRQQNLWVGTSDNGGVYLFDIKTKRFTNFFPDSIHHNISDRSVFAMYETKAGQLWLGGDKGVDIFDRTTQKFTHYQHDPKNKNSLSNNAVYTIMEDYNGNLWLGTADGLNFFDTRAKTFKAFTEKDGLPNNTVWSVQQDQHGNLWIGTNNGLSNFNFLTRAFRNYTVSDGLQNNAFKARASYQSPDGEMFFGGVNGFNTFYPDSIKNNDFVPPVYFTSFQVFNKQVGIGDNSPLKRSINEVREITLSYSQSVFTIEFAALNFVHPEQNMYAYKLEGFDKEWNYVGKKRTATYTNLDPGTYTFKVKGSNNDGIWNEVGASIKIIVTPPFWLTWWFVTAVFLLIACCIFWAYRFRVKGIQKQKILLQQKVNQQTLQLVHLNEEEHKARVEAEQARAESDIARQEAWLTNEELQIKNKELEQFAYVASHDLEEPLRTTAGFVELLQQQYGGKVNEKAEKYLGLISDATSRMKVLIKDLLDFSRIGVKGELKTIDCNIILENMLTDITAAIKDARADIQYTEMPVINGYPTEIKLLFQNLVINAMKFRRKDINPRIKISAQKKEGYWEFSVSDNGIGIEKKHRERVFDIFQRLHTIKEYAGSGIGLSHCKKIVELHKGKIWLESSVGEGTTFYFTIPLNNNMETKTKMEALTQDSILYAR